MITRSFKKADDYTLDMIAKKDGKVLTITRTVYNKDGKTRVSTQTGVDAQGPPHPEYDRLRETIATISTPIETKMRPCRAGLD